MMTSEQMPRKRLAEDEKDASLLWAEIRALRAALAQANVNAERFERGWYLRGDALEKLQQWAQAYPIAVFPEPDLKRAHEVLTAAGITLDAISASAMRHVITQTTKIVDEGLNA